MTGGVNRVGQRVDKFLVTGIASEQRGDGSYIMTGGRLVKNVEHYTVCCPECYIEAWYDGQFDPICPDCGIVCAGEFEKMLLPVDETSRSRCNGGASGFPAINDAHQTSEPHDVRRSNAEASRDFDEAGA